MDGESTNQLVSLLVKSIQAFCSRHLQFSSCVEVIGHIHLNIDHCVKLDYVLSEEVSKAVSDSGASFSSHSYLSQPPAHMSETRNRRAGTESHTHSHRVCSETTNSGPQSVSTSSSQDSPSDENRSFAVNVDQLAEPPMTSDQMKVTVSFNYSSVPPIIKQETNQPSGFLVSEAAMSAVKENCQIVDTSTMSCQQTATVSQENVQPAVSYRQENVEPIVSYRQENTHSTQDNIQPSLIYSQENTQPVVGTVGEINQSGMIHIEEVRSEALQSDTTSLHQSSQSTVPVTGLQESCQTNVQKNGVPAVTNTHKTNQLGPAFLQTSCLPSVNQGMEDNSASVHCDRDVSSPGNFHCPVAKNSFQVDMGSNIRFENLSLDVVAVKEEVLDETPDCQDSPYNMDSGQEREIPDFTNREIPDFTAREIPDFTAREISDFSNVVIETLGHPVDGAQLIVVRERAQQQQLPFPVMLHALPGLSGSVSVDGVPVSASELSVPCSSTDLTEAFVSEDDASNNTAWKKRRKGFQPGNQCWKLQSRWRTAAKINQTSLHQGALAGQTSESKVRGSTSLESKAKIIKQRLHDGSARIKSLSSASAQTADKKGSLRLSGAVRTGSADVQMNRKKVTRQGCGTASSGTNPKGPIHILKKIPWAGQKVQPRKLCRVCKEKGTYPMSCYFCPRCPKQPGYCRVRSCFTSFHSEMGLKHSVPCA